MLSLPAIIRILVVVVISLFIFQILRKKGKVKRENISIVGLIASVHAAVKIVISMTQGSMESTTFLLVNLAILVIGLVILFLWGLSIKSIDKKSF